MTFPRPLIPILAAILVAAAASPAPCRDERPVRLHLSDGTQIVCALAGESDAGYAVRTTWGLEIVVPRTNVIAVEDIRSSAATRPTSVVRFELDDTGGAEKTEPRLLRNRGSEPRSEFRFLVAGRPDAVHRADGASVPFETESRPHATVVTVRLKEPVPPGGEAAVAVRTRDPGACARVSAAEAVFRYRRGAPADETAVIQVTLPPGWKSLGTTPAALEVPKGTLLFRRELAQGQSFDVEVRMATSSR